MTISPKAKLTLGIASLVIALALVILTRGLRTASAGGFFTLMGLILIATARRGTRDAK